MPESVYRVIHIIGSSPTSWEEAAAHAIKKTGQNLRDLRIAEVDKLDVRIEEGRVTAYRARLNLSFRYEEHD